MTKPVSSKIERHTDNILRQVRVDTSTYAYNHVILGTIEVDMVDEFYLQIWRKMSGDDTFNRIVLGTSEDAAR